MNSYRWTPRIPFMALAGALALAASCSRPGPKTDENSATTAGKSPATEKTAGGKTSTPAPAEKPPRIVLLPVDRAGYDKVIGRHRGKVVFVDFWADS